MYDKPFHKEDLSKYNFLVTGGAGFIGSHIVEYLLKYGAKKVRVLDNLLTGRKENIQPFLQNPAFEFIEGDIRNLEICKSACEKIDFVSHQAALGSVPRSIKDPITTNSINVDGFLNMLIAAKDNFVQQFIYASSSSVYGDEMTLPKKEEKIGKPISPYAVSKLTNELYAKVFADTFQMQLVGLRYFNIFGPRQDPNGPYAAVIPLFIDSNFKNKSANIDSDGLQTRDFTFVENAVQANILAMLTKNKEAVNQVYNIAVGENFSILDLYKIIGEITGRRTEPEFRETRKGDVRQSLADISKAKKLLNYIPQIKFREGLEMTIESFRK